MSLLGIFIAIILVFVAIWAVQTLAAAFAIPDPIRAVIMVLIVVLFVIWIVSAFGGGGVSLGSVNAPRIRG